MTLKPQLLELTKINQTDLLLLCGSMMSGTAYNAERSRAKHPPDVTCYANNYDRGLNREKKKIPDKMA